MKPNNTLRTLATVVALMAATCSDQKEEMTDCQRACIESVLKNPNTVAHADRVSKQEKADANRACLPTAEESDDADVKKELAPTSLEGRSLFVILAARFSKESPYRPDIVRFADVKKSLEARPDLLYSLNQMEKTGGQPDVIDIEGDSLVFADVSRESPKFRRNLNYDQVKSMANEMGVEIMDEATYRKLQVQYPIDVRSSSWLLANEGSRFLGGSLTAMRISSGVSVLNISSYRDPNRGWRASLRVQILP